MSQIYFWNKALPVSDSSSVHHQKFFTVHTAIVYVIQVCWQLASRIRTEFPSDPEFCGTQSSSGHFEKEKNLFPPLEYEPRVVHVLAQSLYRPCDPGPHNNNNNDNNNNVYICYIFNSKFQTSSHSVNLKKKNFFKEMKKTN